MPILARLAYADGTSPTTVLFLRFTIAGLVMLALLRLSGGRLPGGRTLLGLVLMGGVGYVGQSLAYFTALTLASASLVALLLYLYPALVTVLSVIFLKERLTALKLAALGLALAGSYLTMDQELSGRPLGILFGIGAAVIYSIYIVAGSRLLKKVPALPASTVVMVSAGMVYAVLAPLNGLQLPQTWGGWAAVLGVALVGTVLAITTFFAGLERIGPVNASTISTLEPVVSVLLAALVLDEQLSAQRLLGGALILAAVLILTRSSAQ